MPENIPATHIQLMRSCARKDPGWYLSNSPAWARITAEGYAREVRPCIGKGVKAWALTDAGRKIVIRNWGE